ncbi:hypothetical protein BJ508DRAFT_314325 [Ascobolus immersus RN42]|uniref:Uncharacterized protein n=1 Tax=Ascobolus immersus RN42 TaxID=1160509 RepID=A0A3N4HFH9_ASCIM|nr:hypothetical protein BJ508DRAFT_314325 [Ascobolus immersus RN42]
MKRTEARAEVIVNTNWRTVTTELAVKKRELDAAIRSVRPANQRIEEILEDAPPRQFLFSAQSSTPQARSKLTAQPTTPVVIEPATPVVSALPTVQPAEPPTNSGPVSLTSFPTRSQEKDLDRACIYLRETTGCDYRPQGLTKIRVFPTTHIGDTASRGEQLAPDLIHKAIQDSKTYVPGSGQYANLEFANNRPGQLLVNPGQPSSGSFQGYTNNNDYGQYDGYSNYNYNNQNGQYYGNNGPNRGRGRGQGPRGRGY